ncbi:unnamed protein product [Citrullus colocynthis]|uniref:Uncharacterized protein n=1 Tax=Citrullus colocynthis TaxID=252529 RepID=A0ABP0Z8U6_9ROSI
MSFSTTAPCLGTRMSRLEAKPLEWLNLQAIECKRTKPEAASPSIKKGNHSYAEVASILKMDGAHLPGIVNPAQLAWWIKMSLMDHKLSNTKAMVIEVCMLLKFCAVYECVSYMWINE